MSSISLLRELFAYDEWAFAKSLESITPEIDAGNPRPRLWLAHCIEARQIWLERLLGTSPTRSPFPEWSMAEVASTAVKCHAAWASFWEGRTDADLSQVIAYRNSRGEFFERPMQDILTQLAMHGQHHRGQVATAVREAGGKPAATDYILYANERPA
ncbi:hypothetical protein GC173_15245 [bacterium]|nr:hypothetical protein [bacterium]